MAAGRTSSRARKCVSAALLPRITAPASSKEAILSPRSGVEMPSSRGPSRFAIMKCHPKTESKQTGARRRHPANVGRGRLFPSSPYLRYVFIFVRIVQTEAADFFLPNGLLDELLLITAPSRKVRKREAEEACEMMPRRRQCRSTGQSA